MLLQAPANKSRGQEDTQSSENLIAIANLLQVVGTGKHVLGYVVIGPMGLLLLAEKTRVSATLPGNHQVKTIVTSHWHKIPLQVRVGYFVHLFTTSSGDVGPIVFSFILFPMPAAGREDTCLCHTARQPSQDHRNLLQAQDSSA